MEIEEKIKLLAKMRAFGVKKLIKLGDSYACLIPRSWVEFNGIEIDNGYYVTLCVEGNKLIFSLIDTENLEEITVKER